jgi:hypothetical protein
MAVAVGAQGIDLGQPAIFCGHDADLLELEGLVASGSGDINFPWLIQLSSTMGNMLTNAMFWNPAYYDPEIGYDATGINQNWQGAGGREAVGGSSIWW